MEAVDGVCKCKPLKEVLRSEQALRRVDACGVLVTG